MPPTLSMLGVSKAFGPTTALSDVSFTVEAGSVHALLGENGAGKSTLMKILSGAYQPDAGTLALAEVPFRPDGPQEARRAGVAMIYQELNLAPHLSVEDNIMLGEEANSAGWLRRERQRPRVRAALAELGHPDIPLDRPVGELSVGTRQLVEIARALAFDARVIVFDEPTSSLTQRDTARLFDVICRLRDSGRAIVYISHFLEEIRQICDSYTVLRDGRLAGAGSLRDTSDSEIARLMIGRSLNELFPVVPRTPGETVLRVDNLHGPRLPRGASLELRRGEILGLAGLVGSGRTELLRCVYGLDRPASGSISVKGQPVAYAGPARRIAEGFGLVSEDRKGEGLAQSRTIADNLVASRLQPYSTAGWLRPSKLLRSARDWMGRLQVKARGPEQLIAELSGGNQQKVAIARVLHQGADIILLDEPTRGIDVGTKSEIYRLMGEAAANGAAVLFVSSYFTELLAVCDRISVMVRGTVRDTRPASDWSEETLMECATGAATTN
jgi:ribose transport system ATP-binding protein